MPIPNIGSIYKRKLMHKEAIDHFTKARKIDPSRFENWEEIMIVFANMGDYASAEKAYHNGAILGLKNDHRTFWDQGKTLPGQKEKDPLEYFTSKKFFERDFAGLIEMVDTTKMIEPLDRAWWKTMSYWGLGVQDSAKHYGQFYLDKIGGQNAYTDIALGNKEKVIGSIHEGIRRSPPSDKMVYCGLRASEVGALAALGDYEEAAELLIKLNREYPEYGGYAGLFNSPLLDKARRESPAFVKALNSLRLPPKLDLEGHSKF